MVHSIPFNYGDMRDSVTVAREIEHEQSLHSLLGSSLASLCSHPRTHTIRVHTCAHTVTLPTV